MTKIIQRLKRFFNQTHVHNAIRVVCQAVLIAALAAAFLFLVVVVITAAVS